MSEEDYHKGLDSLGEAFNKAIDYHVREYKLTYDAVIGCLEIVKLNMWKELLEKQEDSGDPL